MSLAASAVTVAAGTAARPSWREEQRRDREARALLDIEREAARTRNRIAEQESAQRLRQAADENRRRARAQAAEDRAARREALGNWVKAHVTDLLFVPVIGVPALLAWTAMAAYGAHLYGPWGRALPAFSEGAMWAFAAAATITRHRDDKRRETDPGAPASPLWHLRLGTAVFAGFGAVLNFAHGLTLSGPVTGVVMALISVAGVTAHQLTKAGPRPARRARRTRAERDADRIAALAAKRVLQAREEAVKAAAVELAPDGTARLAYRAATPAEAAPVAADPPPEADTPAPPAQTPKRASRTPAAAPARQAQTDTAAAVARLRAKNPGMRAEVIAERIGVSPRTVRRHLASPKATPSPETA